MTRIYILLVSLSFCMPNLYATTLDSLRLDFLQSLSFFRNQTYNLKLTIGVIDKNGKTVEASRNMFVQGCKGEYIIDYDGLTYLYNRNFLLSMDKTKKLVMLNDPVKNQDKLFFNFLSDSSFFTEIQNISLLYDSLGHRNYIVEFKDEYLYKKWKISFNPIKLNVVSSELVFDRPQKNQPTEIYLITTYNYSENFDYTNFKHIISGDFIIQKKSGKYKLHPSFQYFTFYNYLNINK